MLWPFRDLHPDHPAFAAVNMLAVQRCLPLHADDVEFRAGDPPTPEWIDAVVRSTHEQLSPMQRGFEPPQNAKTRGEFALKWWGMIRDGQWKPYERQSTGDADGDDIADRDDALAVDPQNAALPAHGKDG